MATLDAPYLPQTQNAIVEGTPVDDDPLGEGQGIDDQAAPDSEPITLDLGPWLTRDETEVAKILDREWVKQAPGMKSRLDRWRLSERRRAGDSYSKMVADNDTDQMKIYIPPGIEYAPPTFSRTDELCEKMVAQILADPPAPQCEAAKDSEADKDAAEFATRFLEDQNAESNLNIIEKIDMAEDIACSCGSGFIWVYGDPQGGKPKHKMRQASMQAQHISEATKTADGLPQPEPFVERYVQPDGMLTEDSTAADIEFTPKLCAKVGSGRNARFLPETCTGIEDAYGVLWAEFVTLGQLKARFSDLATWKEEDLRAIVQYRPEQTVLLLPRWARGTKDKSDPSAKGPSDDEQVLTITAVQKGGPEHPKGAYAVMVGGKFILYRGPWVRKVIDAETKQEKEVHNSIWLAQFRQFFKTTDHDPYGQGVIEKIIDGDPVIALCIGSILDRITKANNPHMFVPIGGGISDKSLTLPRGTPIPYNAAQGTPVYEQLGDFPPEVGQLLSITDQRMQTRIGLSDTAQGLETSDAQSGIAKTRVIQQANIALSRVKRGMEGGFIRLQRCIVEAGQMLFTAPEMIAVTGKDGAYKYEAFTAADLGTTVDVRIKPGTSTMLAPDMKEDMILQRLQAQIITPEQAQDYIRGNLRAQTGLEDDPVLLRVNRQIGQFEQGPPEGWQGPPPPPPPQQVGVDQMGQPMTQEQPAPPDPANPFANALPVDDEPIVAKTRHWELRKLLSGTSYQTQPPPWQQYALAEYDRARRAAGITTLAEQAQAAQQQQQEQQQAEVQGDIQKAQAKAHANAQAKAQFNPQSIQPDPNEPANLPPGVAR